MRVSPGTPARITGEKMFFLRFAQLVDVSLGLSKLIFATTWERLLRTKLTERTQTHVHT